MIRDMALVTFGIFGALVVTLVFDIGVTRETWKDFVRHVVVAAMVALIGGGILLLLAVVLRALRGTYGA